MHSIDLEGGPGVLLGRNSKLLSYRQNELISEKENTEDTHTELLTVINWGDSCGLLAIGNMEKLHNF
jgi:hypothetical protein